MAEVQKHLRDMGIATGTLRIYKREVSQFLNYLDACSISYPSTYHELDLLLADYINTLFQEGEPISRAGWVLSGMKRLFPRCRKELQTSQQWYTNWTRSHVPQRATPITWNIVQGFLGLCIEQRWYSLALTILLNFVFFLRTGEALGLAFEHLSLDHSSHSVVLNLRYTKASKQFQQFVAHSDPHFFVIVSYLASNLSHKGKIWPYSLSYFRTCFSGLCTFFDLESLHLVLYSLRRGGATHFYGTQKALDFVMVQGRWKDQRTARQYLDDARATLVSLRLTSTSEELISHFRRSFLSCVTSLRK